MLMPASAMEVVIFAPSPGRSVPSTRNAAMPVAGLKPAMPSASTPSSSPPTSISSSAATAARSRPPPASASSSTGSLATWRAGEPLREVVSGGDDVVVGRARDDAPSLSAIVRQLGGEVHERNRAASRELRQNAVPAVNRLRLDEQRVQRLLEEAVRLGLRFGLDERR